MASGTDASDERSLLDAAIALAQTQLLAQVADDASLDGRTTGLVGFIDRFLARERRPSSLDLGQAATHFYERYATDPALQALEQLLSDLGAAFDDNARRISAKRARLQVAIAVLLAGLSVAALLIASN